MRIIKLFFSSVAILTLLFPLKEYAQVDSLETSNVDSSVFNLYISNQSFALDTVDIAVYLDDHLIVKRDFYVEIQHTWVNFQYQISNGRHTLRVESTKGSSTVENEFLLPKTCWAVVEFWYYPTVTGGAGPTPKHLNVHFMETKPMFN